MKKVLVIILVTFASGAFAQVVAIKKIDFAGTKIIVHYDLEDSNPSHEYQLQLYSSKDNFLNPLTKVKGDIGNEIMPGVDKKIEWSIQEEYGNYKGRISLELRGKMYVPFVKLQNFDVSKSYKRGTSFSLTWKTGASNPIHIELYKGNERVSGELNHPNNGAFTMFIPSHAKPGKDYRLKISDSRVSADVIYTDYFQVTPKVPVWAKIAPVVVVGVVVAVLVSGGGGEEPPPGDEVNELPVAPNP